MKEKQLHAGKANSVPMAQESGNAFEPTIRESTDKLFRLERKESRTGTGSIRHKHRRALRALKVAEKVEGWAVPATLSVMTVAVLSAATLGKINDTAAMYLLWIGGTSFAVTLADVAVTESIYRVARGRWRKLPASREIPC